MISVVSVGPPDGEVLDFVDCFMERSRLLRVGDRGDHNFVFDQLLVVWSPRKRVDEVISNFPLEFLPLPMLTLAMLNIRSCVVTFVRVELLTSFPESTKKTAVLLVDKPVVVCLFPATPKAVVASNLHLKSQV